MIDHAEEHAGAEREDVRREPHALGVTPGAHMAALGDHVALCLVGSRRPAIVGGGRASARASDVEERAGLVVVLLESAFLRTPPEAVRTGCCVGARR